MSVQTGGDMYLPRGIKDAVRDGAAPEAPSRPQFQSSVGVQQLETVRNGAKYTLKGLLAFQWASLYMSLAQYAALGAVALLAAAAYSAGAAQAYAGSLDGGAFGMGGWAVGSVAFVLCLLAAFNALLGIRASHKGRAELGPLQRREVEAAERAFWRGVVALLVGAAVTLWLVFQEQDHLGGPGLRNATLYGLVAAAATGLVASSYFGSFFTRYLRNLSPGVSKKSRRRFRRLFVLSWALPVAFAIAGVAAVGSANEYGCYFDETSCGGQQWTMSSPAYGPPFYLIGELVYQQYMSYYTALGLVAGGLLFSRLLGVLALGSYRRQLTTAELVLRTRIRAATPPAQPPA